jgi:hypothetical protein
VTPAAGHYQLEVQALNDNAKVPAVVTDLNVSKHYKRK